MFLYNIITNKINVKHLILTFIVVFITTNYSIAQLTTDDSPDTLSLVNSLLGNGLTVSNISYKGKRVQRGTFNVVKSTYSEKQRGDTLGIKSGVILSTGYISNATGPNNNQKYGWCNTVYITHHTLSTPGDADLDTIESCGYQCTQEAAVLEFDFIPQSSPLSFKYVFASEEYPCFVCSPFNAVFAFLVTSLESDGFNYHKKNVALIPGTNIPVCINSVNGGTVGTDSIAQEFNEDTACISLSYSQYFVNNGDGSTPALDSTVQYNGFTVPLTATVDVMPCKKYHIKLAVANVGDNFFDSAVLLQANSFFTNNTMTVSITFSNPANDSVAVKGCNNAIVTFKLLKVAAKDTTITYTVGGTAVNGQDYQQVSGILKIDSGQTTGTFNIVPFLNGVTSGDLTVTITVPLSKCGIPQTYTIKIKANNLSATISPSGPDSLCVNESTTFSVTGQNSSGYSYKWSNGSTNPIYTVTNNNPPSIVTYTYYKVTVTDIYGCTIPDSVSVYEFPDISKLFMPKDTTGFTPLTVNFKYTGTNNVTWIFGDGTPPTTSKQSNFDHVYRYNSNLDTHGTDSVIYYAEIKMGKCEDSAEIIVKLPVILNIPNVFTPNGDAIDDNFSIECNGGIMSVEVTIYNRWGVKICSTSYAPLVVDKTLPTSSSEYKYYKMWDGTKNNNNGEKVDDGVYFYILKPVGTDGNTITPKAGKLEGSITVIDHK